jgi:3-oxoacyl-[acyl-carrier protein] reductase
VLKNVLVTGATRGLGFEIARRLIDDGFRVIGTGRSVPDQVRALAASHPEQFVFAPYDLAEVSGLQAFVLGITKDKGPIFGLINNAATGVDGVLGTMHNSDIERVLRVNLLAPIILTKYITRTMMRHREGRVVNISSIIASTGFKGLTAYAGSKSGIEGFTKSVAREIGQFNVTVNCVAPGFMETAMTSGLNDDKLQKIIGRSPLRRLAAPVDVAGAVSFLLGPNGGSITGTVITVDAGSTS